MKLKIGLSIVTLIVLAACGQEAQQRNDEDVGAVHFPVGCNAAASTAIEQGVAQLHHMMYVNARGMFRDAESADPGCAIALWGVAMTYIHPLWSDRPSETILTDGAELTARAVSIGGRDDREDAYISTTTAYFQNGASRSEAERLMDFEAAWKAVYESHPTDQEAKAFYALAQLATADPSDKTYAKQLDAGALVEEVLEGEPTHPGAHHYIIHAYDLPELAQRALPVARNYGVVAPEVPHALHMMSHIFTRLGLWDESIEWNQRAANAAWRLSEQLGAISFHYQHALDYLAYAHLQKGEDDDALEVVRTMASLSAPFDAVNRDAAAYAFAAVPARYALERKDWDAAAALEPRIPAQFPWEPAHAPYVALTHFSRGLGLAHENRFDEAEAEVVMLGEIHEQVATRSPYWATQVEIQRMSLEAWIAFLGGDTDGGLSRMREAAALETTTEKSPVTPGEVLPASELLGEMLAEQGLYEEALDAYRVVLDRSLLRLNSLFGAGQALEAMGDREAAGAYYAEIVAMGGEGSARPSIRHALEF